MQPPARCSNQPGAFTLTSVHMSSPFSGIFIHVVQYKEIAQPTCVHYTHCASPPVCLVNLSVFLPVNRLEISENAHNSWATWFILIKFCICMHVCIFKPLACVTAFLSIPDLCLLFYFAEHQSGRSWSVSENAHNSRATRHTVYLDQILHNYLF